MNDQQAGFGKVLKELKDFVNPKHTDSVLFKYKQSLEQVTDEMDYSERQSDLNWQRKEGPQKLQDIAEKWVSKRRKRKFLGRAH